MLSGVPGTGTRDDGYAGALLRVNLDWIVLLRFHALCLKVSLFCVMVALGLLLPLNYTAQCYNFLNVEDATDDVSIDTETTIPEECRSNSIYGQSTNYDRSTIENIPALEEFVLPSTGGGSVGGDVSNGTPERYGTPDTEQGMGTILVHCHCKLGNCGVCMSFAQDGVEGSLGFA